MVKYNLIKCLISFILVTAAISCNSDDEYYEAADFVKVPKTDAHFHYLTPETQYMEFAESLNFRLLNPIWEGEVPIDTQLAISTIIKQKHPLSYRFFTSFPTNNISDENFADSAIDYIRMAMNKGATGVKIWKNIGMVIRMTDSSFLMADGPVLAPLFKYLSANKIPVIGHLGEPKDCWLPLDQMTDRGDSLYYAGNPWYHMYFHPEVPSYEKQIEAMEKLLENNPGLDYTGAHLASIEWSIDELAELLDRFPGMKVDLAARISHLQSQSDDDREHVRNFFIKYQDRIVYGTDSEVHDVPGKNPSELKEGLRRGWQNHWNYLATDTCRGHAGLRLPRKVIDKIYYLNTNKYYNQ